MSLKGKKGLLQGSGPISPASSRPPGQWEGRSPGLPVKWSPGCHLSSLPYTFSSRCFQGNNRGRGSWVFGPGVWAPGLQMEENKPARPPRPPRSADCQTFIKCRVVVRVWAPESKCRCGNPYAETLGRSPPSLGLVCPMP